VERLNSFDTKYIKGADQTADELKILTHEVAKLRSMIDTLDQKFKEQI
jgi:hypothetical protein